ncbi:hypothetical protein [Brevinema andersonii]|nr:hypothetical protein [Brevinema andersonii]
MNSGDICRITVSVNNKKKVLIFSGSIETVMTTSRDIIIEASYHLFDDKDMNETFKDTSYQDVFLRLTDKLEYRTEDFTPRQIVLKGNKEDNARRLLQSCSHALRRPLYCYLNAQNRLIITDNMGKHKANIFIIDNVLVSVGRVQFVIFPIPEIEIGDRVRLKGKEYRVKAITYDFTMKAFMRLEVL